LAADPIANLVLLENATIVGGLPGATISFHAGLGITWSGGWYAENCTSILRRSCWARKVEDAVENRTTPTLHELGIYNGDVTGASDILFAGVNPYFSSAAVGGTGKWNGISFYGLYINTDIGVYPRNNPWWWWIVFGGVLVISVWLIMKAKGIITKRV
jgi:hypothetical protein